MAVVTVQRTEKSQAVRYDPDDETDHGVIRGWIGAPELYSLVEVDSLVPGSWIVRERGESVYQLSDEAFRREFAIVVVA